MTRLPDPDHLHTTTQAARALDVPAALIRKWQHRDQIAHAGRLPAAAPGGSIPLYRLDELRPLAEAYHLKARHREKTVHGTR